MNDQTTPPPHDERTAAIPGLAMPAIDAVAIAPGAMVGPYRIVQRLGAGGMGDVWLAEQLHPIRRVVALKLIQRQLMGGLAEAYFEVERQALARMDHPAIAKVFDAGRTAHGFPYFAMERIDGVPLHRWRENESPALRERIILMMVLARGVQHAHQRGIVHRDLKPTNVLVARVDGRPQPKIIDFGIAVGVDDRPEQSGPGSYEVAGTAMYMSPEQSAGLAEAVDTRSDVYALGMILLGLLLPAPGLGTLGPDFPTPEELDRLLASSLGRRVTGSRALALRTIPWDLRHLLRRALAPSREQRLPTAAMLAEELERFLDARALESVPPSGLYRAGRFARRHRFGIVAAAAVLAALVLGLGAALHGMFRAEQEAQRSRAMAEFLSDVLGGVDPDRARGLDRSLLHLILDEAAERARSELGMQPDVLADIEGVIGGTYASLGDYARAVEFSMQAHQRSTAMLGPDHQQTLRLARRLADALSSSGRASDAESIAALAHVKAVAGHPREHRLIADLALALGWAQRELGRFEDGLASIRSAVARLEQVQAKASTDPDPLNARYLEAILLSDLERFDEAEEQLRELIELRTQAQGADHPHTLRLRNSLAVLLLQSRRYVEAEPVLRDALSAHERTFGENHAATLGVISNLAGALRQQGKIQESGPFYRRALEGLVATQGEAHPRSIVARHNHANFLLNTDQPEAALDEQLKALALAEPLWGREHPITSEIIGAVGKAWIDLGRLDEAEAIIGEALALKRRIHGERHRTIDNLEAELVRIESMRAQ
ncbi:MAG TPA: serine/threonine-protein kinase [Xanthomonadaceae bacterium]|nr:serine/threonine-protein kinase [Xanthomonadaceae bacterium]